MATKYEEYTGGTYGILEMLAAYNGFWLAQTFTPATTHTITRLRLHLRKADTVDTITVGIRATSGGEPTGSDLASASIDPADVTADVAGSWVTVDLDSAYSLVASTKYAIVLRCTVTGGEIDWRGSSTGDYAGGNALVSLDSGGSWSAYSNDLAFEDWGYGVFHPSDSVARVSSIRHIFQPSKFVMQVGLGDLGFDVDVAEVTVRDALDTAKEIEKAPAEPVVEKPKPTRYEPEEVKSPEPVELTDYAKDILRKPAARALAARVAGLRQGVEAVVTPYAIDVLIQKEQEATKLIQLQRIQKAASATGITGYAKQVLENKALALKRELETLYRRPR